MEVVASTHDMQGRMGAGNKKRNAPRQGKLAPEVPCRAELLRRGGSFEPSKKSEGSRPEKRARKQTVRPDTQRTKPEIPAWRASAHASAKASHGNSGARKSGKTGQSPEMHDTHTERTSRDSTESLRSESAGMRTEIQMRRSPGKATETSESPASLRLATETRVQPLGQMAKPKSRCRQSSEESADRSKDRGSGDTAPCTKGGRL